MAKFYDTDTNGPGLVNTDSGKPYSYYPEYIRNRLMEKTQSVYDAVAPSSSGSLSSRGGASSSVNLTSGSSSVDFSPSALSDALVQQDDINYARSQDLLAWQERLSNSAHQREVADLRAAGLNPVLSAGGSGASTPSGTMYANSSADRKLAIFQSLLSAETAVKQSQIAAGATLGAAQISADASGRNSGLGALASVIGTISKMV